MKFYTSDLHFGHRKIMEYENRPFSSVEEMDECLISNWNAKVAKGDSVYIVGDFGFVKGERANELLSRLNGSKYLIRGNHDNYFLNDKEFDKSNFVWIKDYATVKDQDEVICMFHYPIAVWDRQHYGTLHFYGHVHSNTETRHPLLLDLGDNAYNVGCDVHNYAPVTLDELLSERKKQS